MAVERLQKILARAGLASRRHAEELIVKGRVRVNGRVVTELGARAHSRKDRIEVDGKRIVAERHVYVLLHKPRNVVTTLNDPEGRDTIANLLHGIDARVYPVGRLDFHTSGALLVTNDGALTEALLHPARRVPKTYVAKVKGHLDEKALEALGKGVTLDDGYRTAPAQVLVLREEPGSTWLQITIHEGKNRQIHRMVEACGHYVMRLARTSFAGLSHEGLKPGQWRELEEKELLELRKKYMLAAPGAAQPHLSGKHRSDPSSGRPAGPAPKKRAPVSGQPIRTKRAKPEPDPRSRARARKRPA